MTRTIRYLLGIFGLLLVLGFTEPASAQKIEYGRVLVKDANLRAQASADSELVQKLAIGDELEVLREENGWYYVASNGKTGYIRSDLLFVSSMDKRICYAKEDGVNLRGGPGMSAYVTAKVAAGRPMQIISVVNDWLFVKYEGATGFVNRSTVSVNCRTGGVSSMFLQMGMEGMEVKRLQQELANRNFLSKQNVTGLYGSLTRQAVKEFQKAASLKSEDGIAGEETIKLIYDPANKTKKAAAVPVSRNDFFGIVRQIDWWKGGSSVLKRPGGVATIFDVRSGRSFRIIRTGGTNHNDIAPYSAKDAAILKGVYGGRWSWDRRAILVITNGRVYAASMNGMPHGGDVRKNDGVVGMFCIHFTNSKTHGGNRVDADHQRMLKYAFSAFAKK